jgi:hypothetical protein
MKIKVKGVVVNLWAVAYIVVAIVLLVGMDKWLIS